MNFSSNGQNLLKQYEGWSATPYRDGGGVPTIGWGSTFDDEDHPITMSHQQIDETTAQRYFDHSLTKFIKHVNTFCDGISLTQNQFDALVVFCYNEGMVLPTSTIGKTLKASGPSKVTSDMWTAWDKIHKNGVVIADKGLYNRRVEEYTLFCR